MKAAHPCLLKQRHKTPRTAHACAMQVTKAAGLQAPIAAQHVGLLCQALLNAATSELAVTLLKLAPSLLEPTYATHHM